MYAINLLGQRVLCDAEITLTPAVTWICCKLRAGVSWMDAVFTGAETRLSNLGHNFTLGASHSFTDWCEVANNNKQTSKHKKCLCLSFRARPCSHPRNRRGLLPLEGCQSGMWGTGGHGVTGRGGPAAQLQWLLVSQDQSQAPCCPSRPGGPASANLSGLI